MSKNTRGCSDAGGHLENQSTTPFEIRYEATASFIGLLETMGCSLALSVYTSNRVVMLSAKDNALQMYSGAFRRPMGLATKIVGGSHRLAIATFQELVLMGDAPLLGASLPDASCRFDHVLVPRVSLYCGDIDAHDLVWIGGELFAANTRFSCIAKVDAESSFGPAWSPPFISELMPDDRCHLNGIAASDEQILYVTAFGATNEPRGWSGQRAQGGLLLEVPSGRPILHGLSMPHSPRVFDGDVYVLESGTGRVLHVDVAAHSARSIAELPGFVRGLDRHGDVLFVGMSRMRDRAGVRLPVQDKHPALMCGVAAIDRHGFIIGWLHFGDMMDEIFDVKVLPNFQNSAILGVDDERHRRALVLPGRAFWGEPFEDAAARIKAQQDPAV
jgi:uncharacterized protein (TIGR03032 family)